jgi:hypothetical protein
VVAHTCSRGLRADYVRNGYTKGMKLRLGCAQTEDSTQGLLVWGDAKQTNAKSQKVGKDGFVRAGQRGRVLQ